MMRYETLAVSFGGIPIGIVELVDKEGLLRFARGGRPRDTFMRDAVWRASRSLCGKAPAVPTEEPTVLGEAAFLIAMGILVEMKRLGFLVDTGGGAGAVRASDAEVTRAYVDIWTRYASSIQVPFCVPHTRAELLLSVNDYVQHERVDGGSGKAG